MKLADDALIRIIEIFRQGLMEGKDVSDLLRTLELEPDVQGKLAVSSSGEASWMTSSAPETD